MELDRVRERVLAENRQLDQQGKRLSEDLSTAAQDMEQMSDEMTHLKAALHQSDSTADRLNREKEQLSAENDHPREQIQRQAAADDEVMPAIDSRVDEWKAVLESRDAELSA